MEATVTQPLAITEPRRRSLQTRSKAALEDAMRALAMSARGEAYDRVLGSPDVEARLWARPLIEKERLLARGFGKSH